MAHYVGQLYAVVVEDENGVAREIEVSRVLLFVDAETGLETAPSKAAGSAGEYYGSDQELPWFNLIQVVYYRPRPEGSDWYHDVSGHCALVQNGRAKLFVLLSVPDARRCAMPGDFICGG